MAQKHAPSFRHSKLNLSFLKKKYILLVFGILSFIVGKLLHPFPADPDSVIQSTRILGVFFLFIYWISGVLSWGIFLQDRFKFKFPNFGLTLGLGSLVVVLYSMTLGHLGLIGLSYSYLFDCFLFLGFVLSLPVDTGEVSTFRKTPQWTTYIPMLIMGYWLVNLLMHAATPQLHSDPLMVYLIGPRLWFQDGKIDLSPRIPIGMQCSYWEYLFIWANSLLGGTEGRGLIESQIFSQWIHIVFGWLGSLLVLTEILSLLSVPATWIGFAIFSAGNCWLMSWTAVLAKNDWGVTFWTLCGLMCLIRELDTQKQWAPRIFLAGLFLALAIGAKYTALLTVLPMLGIWAIYETRSFGFKKTSKQSLVLASSILLGLAPILIRNLFYTGNPFFPVFGNYFKSPWFSEGLAMIYGGSQGENGRPFWELLRDRILLLLQRDSMVVILFPAAIWLGFLSRSSTRKWIYFASIFSVVCFLVTVSSSKYVEDGTLYLRLFGPGLIIAMAAGTLACFDLLNFWKITRRLIHGLGVLIIAVGLLNTRIPKLAWLHLIPALEGMSFSLTNYQVGGAAKTWLRYSAHPNDLIVSTGDNQLYYLSHLRVASSLENPFLDHAYRTSRSLEDYLRTLLTLNTKYILDSQHFESGYWSMFSYKLNLALTNHPEAILFFGKDSQVIDPARLLAELSQSCEPPNPNILDPYAWIL